MQDVRHAQFEARDLQSYGGAGRFQSGGQRTGPAGLHGQVPGPR